MKYKSLDDVNYIISAFENCTVKRDEWGHPEHLILAYHYSVNNDFESAYDKMKAGIFRLLKAIEVDLSKEMGPGAISPSLKTFACSVEKGAWYPFLHCLL